MDEGAVAGGLCGAFCYGILGQFFNTRTWGANWTCWDKCCRCESCWDAGEFDPADRPGGAKATFKVKEERTHQPEEGDALAPPAYKAADPMSATTSPPTAGIQADALPAADQTQPQSTIASAGAAGATQSGGTSA
jgi:hypothetical protein